MARFYSNENFPFPVVEALRTLGHDVATIQDRGRANEAEPDLDVLRHAISENRAVLTLNRRDFIRLHRENNDHCGIVVCTFDIQFDRQAQQIHDEVAADEDLRGKLVRVNRPGN